MKILCHAKKFRILLQPRRCYLLLAVPALFFVLAAVVSAQIPTVHIPTVTSTDRGVVVTVKNDPSNPQINVRGGPGTEYDRVGTMVIGQQASAIGRTEGGNWLLIEYPGGPGGYAWVYTLYVDFLGDLPVVEIPGTPTPRVTNTIDPTLAARFILTNEPTRLATFTQPAPLVIPTFIGATAGTANGTVPVGLIVIVLFILGLTTGLIALVQRR